MQVYRHIRLTAQAIHWIRTPGQRSYGIVVLGICRDNLNDLGHIALYRAMCDKFSLPYDPDQIDHQGEIPPPQEVHIPAGYEDNVMHGDYEYLTEVLMEGLTQLTPPTSTVGPSSSTAFPFGRRSPSRRERNPPNKLTPEMIWRRMRK